MKQLNVGDKIEVKFNKNFSSILYIQGKTEDEILAIGPTAVFGAVDKYPTSTIVVSSTRTYQGVRLNSGDKVTVLVKKDGKLFPLEMYITQFLDTDAFVLSFKKNSSMTTLKWIMDMMKHY